MVYPKLLPQAGAGKSFRTTMGCVVARTDDRILAGCNIRETSLSVYPVWDLWENLSSADSRTHRVPSLSFELRWKNCYVWQGPLARLEADGPRFTLFSAGSRKRRRGGLEPQILDMQCSALFSCRGVVFPRDRAIFSLHLQHQCLSRLILWQIATFPSTLRPTRS